MTTTPDRTLSNFDENAHHIAKRQYLQAGDGDLGGMFRRIADWVAGAEAPEARLGWAQKYYDLMAEKRFCPGGRVLAGAGTQHGNVLNCFVQGATEHAPESFDGVMEVAKKLALVTKVGGGNGVNLDVYTPRAVSSRPDAGVRGWAYMSATHPDVTDFIEGLMRPPTQPDGEKQPVAVRNWTRVVYGHAIPPELVASARVNGVQIVRALPQGVQPVPDDMGGIIDAARAVAESAKVGVEPRIDLSEMRPEGAPIQGSGGTSSGPVSFLMEIFDNFLEWANRGGETSGPINTLRFVYAPVLRVVRQGGCLHPDTLVHTSRGTLRLRELVDARSFGHQGHTLEVATDEGWRHSPEGFNNGLADTRRITLDNGLTLQGTPNHKLKVLRENGAREWVRFDELRPGDWAIQVLDGHTGTPALLEPLLDPHFNAKRIRTPETLTEDLAFWLGYLWGDGFVSGNRVGFAVAHGSPMMEETPRLFRDLFGLELRREQKENDRSVVFVTRSAALVAWLTRNGLLKGKALSLEVPRPVRQAPRPVLGAFLRGLFEADGTLLHGYPQLSTASRRLAEDVVVLLGGLGIPAKLTRYEALPNRLSAREHYRLNVVSGKGLERYVERVGWLPGSRFGALRTFQPDAGRESAWPLPHAASLLTDLHTSLPAGRKGSPSAFTETRKTLSRYIRGERGLTASGYAALAHNPQIASALPAFDHDEYYVRVQDVTPGDRILTLDISVEENHTYLANGMVSHNTRRGAGMATISIEHPDVLDFLTAKDLDREAAEGDISTFNISILVTEKFWQTLERDGLWHVDVQEVPGKYYLEPQSAMYDGRLPTLPDRAEDGARGVPLYKTAPQGRYNPADKRPGIPAKWLWDQIAQHAWATGEPGLIFVDRVNEYSALKNLGKRYEIRSTNPCGEIPLTVGEPCDLGAINLAAYVRGSTFDYASFRADVRTCVRFLDDVLDVNVFALEDNRVASQDLRRLGLGVMGLADALIKMGLRYDSEAGRQAIYEIMSALREEAVAESERLGQERGVYPVYERNAKKIPHGPRRNVAVLTVAPTGTTSMLMGVSSGIEPIFSPFIWRKIGSEYRALLAPLFVELLNQYPAPAGLEKDGGWDWDKVTEAVSENHGSVVGLAFIPEALQQVFVCAHDIKPEDHVRMQGTVQRAFDDGGQHAANSLSKCIAAGTLIPTSAGLVAIEDFARTLEDDTFTPLDGTLTVDGHRITQHYRAGVKPATRITLDSGATLVGATASHRVLTPEGWRLMSELRPGDTVLGKFLASHGVGGLPIEWTDEYRTNALPVQTPKAMTPALARFLGMLAADGHTTESTGNVGLTCKDAEVETEFTRLCQEVFGLTPRRTVDQRNGVVCLSLTSRNLARYVEALIGKGAYHKHAPKQLLRGSAEEKQAFLEGLTLDGYVWEGGLCLYAGMSEQLAYHAAEMARSFGLPKVYQGRKRVEASGKTCHLVSVSNEMQEILTPVESRKKVKPTQSWYRVHVPAATIAATRLPTSHAGYTNFKSVRGRGALTCKNTSAEQIGWDTGVLAYRVTAVEDAGMVEMYDIEVEGSHAYVVNGMISHNTINLPNSATVQDVQDAYSEAYRTGCKGITVYRDGSRQFQVLSTSKKKEKKAEAAQAAAEVMGESTPEAPKVETPPAPAPAPAAPSRPAQPTTPVYERPARLSGITDMVKLTDPTSGHRRSFLVTVNHLNGKPIEVMVISGRAGDEANADSEALGRVVSIALQHGVPAQALIKTLRGINGGLYGSYNGRLVGSKADLIAVALETFGKDMEAAALPPLAGASVDLPPALPATPSGVSVESMDGMSRERCPVCEEKAVIREEGCLKCQACGYSKCG